MESNDFGRCAARDPRVNAITPTHALMIPHFNAVLDSLLWARTPVANGSVFY